MIVIVFLRFLIIKTQAMGISCKRKNRPDNLLNCQAGIGHSHFFSGESKDLCQDFFDYLDLFGFSVTVNELNRSGIS